MQFAGLRVRLMDRFHARIEAIGHHQEVETSPRIILERQGYNSAASKGK